MSPEEFKINQLLQQIGKMSQDHAAETAELHLRYNVTIQSLQERIVELENAAREKEGEGESPLEVVKGSVEEARPPKGKAKAKVGD